MTKQLDKKILDFINRYFSLEINNQKVVCPYFINKHIIFGKPVRVGKGSPDEIELECKSLISAIDPETIRSEMIENGIGVDCSGFIYNVYDFTTKLKLNKTLSQLLPKPNLFDIRKSIARALRPQNTFGANDFTSEFFSTRISKPDQARPGDLIRTKNGRHILLIYKVELIEDKFNIYYVHSTRFYVNNGMHRGMISLDKNQELEDGVWSDDSENINPDPTYTGYREVINKNGIFRPKLSYEIFID